MASPLYFQPIWRESSTPSHPPGTVITLEDGRKFKYLQASEALSKGNVVRLMNNTGIVINADVDDAALVDTRRLTGTGDFATTALIDAYPDLRSGHRYFIGIDAGATQGQWGQIIARPSANAVDVYWFHSNDGKIDTAFTTSSDYVVICYTRVELTENATDVPIAVAQIAVTDEYWFWGQIKGLGVVLLDTDDSAVTGDDRILIPAASTNGYAQGSSATLTAPELASAIGRTATDQTADGLVLCEINVEGNSTYCANAPLVPYDLDLAFPRFN